MALFASGVKIDPTALGQTQDIASASQKNLKDILGSIQQRFRAGQTASGRVNTNPGDYYDEQMKLAADRGNRNISNSLYGVLGNASLNDARALRTHNQNMELAKLQGELMKPSLLHEVLGGLNGVAPSVGAGYSLWNNYPRQSYDMRSRYGYDSARNTLDPNEGGF